MAQWSHTHPTDEKHLFTTWLPLKIHASPAAVNCRQGRWFMPQKQTIDPCEFLCPCGFMTEVFRGDKAERGRWKGSGSEHWVNIGSHYGPSFFLESISSETWSLFFLKLFCLSLKYEQLYPVKNENKTISIFDQMRSLKPPTMSLCLYF